MTLYRRMAFSTRTAHVAGMVGRDPAGGQVSGVVGQARRAVARLADALAEEGPGLQLSDVVRLRVYLTDVRDWSASVLPVLDDAFEGTLPPCTVLGAVALVEDWMEVELEAEAAVREST